MKIELTPIGFIRTEAESIPCHWTNSDAIGTIAVDEQYRIKGLDMGDGTPVLEIKLLTE